jgi:hypothetical protein
MAVFWRRDPITPCGRPDKLRGRDDGDPAKRVAIEQFGIARDDARGLAGYGKIQELVVSHVAARRDRGDAFAGNTTFYEPVKEGNIT